MTVNGSRVEGHLENGYLVVDRQWRKNDVVRIHFDMVPRTVKANDKVAADRGKVAVERGPLVYCVEWADNKGFNPHHIILGKQPQFNTKAGDAIANT